MLYEVPLRKGRGILYLESSEIYFFCLYFRRRSLEKGILTWRRYDLGHRLKGLDGRLREEFCLRDAGRHDWGTEIGGYRIILYQRWLRPTSEYILNIIFNIIFWILYWIFPVNKSCYILLSGINCCVRMKRYQCSTSTTWGSNLSTSNMWWIIP